MTPYTMCNGCVLSETENNEQIGCRLDRADKIGIQDKDETLLEKRFILRWDFLFS